MTKLKKKKCASCGSQLDLGYQYAIDKNGDYLCTFCWMVAVEEIPILTGGLKYWTGRRYIGGELSSSLEWEMKDHMIQPRGLILTDEEKQQRAEYEAAINEVFKNAGINQFTGRLSSVLSGFYDRN